jgi:hypothetical protein
VVIVREQVLILFLEQDNALLIVRYVKGRKKTLSPILTRNVPYAKAVAEILVINSRILFAKERDMLPNIKLMSMQNLIRAFVMPGGLQS